MSEHARDHVGDPAARALPPPDDARRPPPGAGCVRVASRVVPAARRGEWVAEWLGELDYAWTVQERRGRAGASARAALLVRCVGAIPDAFWMRRRYGGDAMLSHDLRCAVRQFAKRPAFAAVVVLTLALGIGATTAIFSVVNAVLLRSLPYPRPERLVMLWGDPTDGDSAKVGPRSSYPDYQDFRSQARSFEHLAAYQFPVVTLTGGDREPVRVPAVVATANLFPTLGIRPALGRAFLPEDERPSAPRVAMVSHGFWQARFGGDRSVLGATLVIDGVPHTVVGVLPSGLPFRSAAQVWQPLVPGPLDVHRGNHRQVIAGRLAPGVSLERAEAEVRTIAKRLDELYTADNAKRSARVEPMQDAVVGSVRRTLLVLMGAVGLVLLIGCANVANLFLARAASRAREVAVRTALGASRRRLVQQFLTESVMLSLAGGLAGLALAYWSMPLLLRAAPTSLPRTDEVGIDGAVLALVLAVSMLAGIGFGIIPAFQTSRPGASPLTEAGRGATAGAGHRRFRSALVVTEVALAVVLVAAAGLLIKSYWRLQRVDPGFRADNLVAVQLQLPPARYEDIRKVIAFYDELRERAAALPGVQSVAVAMEHPLSEGWTSSFTIEGREPPREGEAPESRVRPMLPGYFRAVGVPLVRGRDISDRAVLGTPGEVIVNEAFVRRHFPGEDPIGKRIRRAAWWPGQPTTFEIVGVAANERFLGLDREADPATYFPLAQFPLNDMYLLVRTSGAPGADPSARAEHGALAAALRQTVWSLDRDVPVDKITTTEELLSQLVAAPRFNTALLTGFAVVALLLAALGVYGVLSYTVALRTQEIGIRMALGAQRARVLRLVVGQGMGLTLLGVGIGLAAALVLTRVLERLLFGVSATDAGVFASVAVILALVALLAAYLPARRASRVDPTVALRTG